MKTVKKSKKRTVINASAPLYINISAEHVKKAKCKDPAFCVIAQTLREHYGDAVDGFQVGRAITKIKMDTKLIRYRTGDKLGIALAKFDETGVWDLPPGRYALNAHNPNPERHLTIKKKDLGKNRYNKAHNKYKRKKYTPARHALTVCQLAPIS